LGERFCKIAKPSCVESVPLGETPGAPKKPGHHQPESATSKRGVKGFCGRQRILGAGRRGIVLDVKGGGEYGLCFALDPACQENPRVLGKTYAIKRNERGLALKHPK